MLYVGLTIFAGLLTYTKFSSSIANIGNTEATAWSADTASILTSQAGYMFVGILIALIIISLILAVQIPTGIIYTPIFALLTLVATWFAYPISISWEAITETGAFADLATSMQVITLIMSKLPFIVLMVGCILSVVTFVRYRSAGGTGLGDGIGGVGGI